MTRASAVVMAVVATISCTKDKPTIVDRAMVVALSDAELIDRRGDGHTGLLVVIGENHASVRSQLEVEATLTALAGAAPLDTLGVEGSIGPIPVHTAGIDELSLLPPAQRRTHVRELITWGEISGAEAFIIANPSTPYVGVENLGAKARWEVAQNARSDTTSIEIERRRAEEVDKAAACLGDAIVNAKDVVAARTRLTATQQRLATAQAAYTDAMAALRPLLEREAALNDDDEAVVAFQRLGWAAWSRQLDQRYDEAKRSPNGAAIVRDLEHARATFKQMFPGGTSELDSPSPAVLEHFRKQRELWSESDKVTQDPKLKKVAEDRTAAIEEVSDAFAEVASELGQRDTAAQCARRVIHFQTEVVAPFLRAEIVDVSERDDNMVRRSLALLHEGKQVAIVVGSHHLAGITARLKQQGKSFLAVAVKSRNEETSAWEVRAWSHRKKHQDPLFVAGFQHMKELSRLVDPSWWQNFAERAHVASELTGNVPARGRVVHEARSGQRVIRDALPGRDVTFVMGDIGLGPTVEVGSHVAGRGTMPATGVYTAFDAEAARKLVVDLSNTDTHFGYARLSDDGGSAVIDAPAAGGGTRPLSLSEVASSGGTGGGKGGGRKPPRRMVMFEAMDSDSSRQFTHDLGTRDAKDQPLWQRLATDSMLFTVNPERAAKNIKRIEAQSQARIRSVTVVRGAKLDGLLQTPTRGDHALTVVIVARNVEEFRTNLTKAAQDGLLEGKQVALVTCGDAFAQTAVLREELLSGGAAMVWVPQRQISEGLGEVLASEVQKTVAELPADHQHTSVETVMRASIERMKATGGHPELPLLEDARTHVMRMRHVDRVTA